MPASQRARLSMHTHARRTRSRFLARHTTPDRTSQHVSGMAARASRHVDSAWHTYEARHCMESSCTSNTEHWQLVIKTRQSCCTSAWEQGGTEPATDTGRAGVTKAG